MLKKSPVTVALIAINVIVFAVIALFQQNILFNRWEDVIALLHAGANFNPLTIGGEPWRLITAMFLHFGVLHLFANMYGLWQLGELLEPGIGSARYAILYFICGVAASLASLFFNVFNISAGASGAVFGLYGFMLTVQIISTYNDRENLKRVLLNFAIFVGINLMIARGISVDMAGHIGGFFMGVIIGLCHFKLRVLQTPRDMSVFFVALWAVLFLVPGWQKKYYDAYQRVLELDDVTNALVNTQMNESVVYDSMKHIGEEWKKVSADFDSIRRVPDEIRADLSSMRQYTKLRALHTAYRLRIMEQTYIYMDSIEIVSAQFDKIPRLQRPLNFEIKPQEEIDSATVDTTSTPQYRLETVYFDKNWRETHDPSAPYYRVGTRDSLGRWQGMVRDFYRNGDVQMKGTYKDGLQNGIFIYYSDHKTYSSAGRYEKEDAVGKWQTFYWNGQLESEIIYGDRMRTMSVWDSLGNPQVVNGNGDVITYYANGVKKEEGRYQNGFRTGVWSGYRDNGEPYYKEEYANNRLLRGMSLGEGKKEFVYDQSSMYPTPTVGTIKFREYLEKNVRRPEDPRQRGVVKLIFSVGADGVLWDFTVLESSCEECNAEAIRLVKEGPSWRPATLHGQEKITSQAYIEVNF